MVVRVELKQLQAIREQVRKSIALVHELPSVVWPVATITAYENMLIIKGQLAAGLMLVYHWLVDIAKNIGKEDRPVTLAELPAGLQAVLQDYINRLSTAVNDSGPISDQFAL